MGEPKKLKIIFSTHITTDKVGRLKRGKKINKIGLSSDCACAPFTEIWTNLPFLNNC